MSPSALAFPWDDFLQFQSAGDRRTTTPDSLGYEEALTALAEAIGAEGDGRSAEGLRHRFDNLHSNRAAKYRHRIELSRRYADERRRTAQVGLPAAGTGDAASADDHVDAFATRELLELVRRELSEADWDLLWSLAVGYSYEEIAAASGASPASLKSRACRVRGQLRETRVGRQLEAALYDGLHLRLAV